MKEDLSYEILAKVPTQPVGWLESKLPIAVMNRLQSYIEEARKKSISVNKDLVGHLSSSLELKDTDDWFFKNILREQISKFKQTWPASVGLVGGHRVAFYMDKFWVNFQKQNEFNPLHDHTGIFSFVIWVKIPTDWREQHTLPLAANSNTPSSSDFEFHYITLLGELGKFTYCLDKTSESVILFFPAKLNHLVYPFYNCDEERISISGNIRFDTSENTSWN